jgi:hypothetical protein
MAAHITPDQWDALSVGEALNLFDFCESWVTEQEKRSAKQAWRSRAGGTSSLGKPKRWG